MEEPPIKASPFEQLRHEEHGREYWLARDLAETLGYTEWRNFEKAIQRGIRACRNSGQDVADHFVKANKMITLGKGGKRSVKDYQLSRYAGYLVIRAPVTGHQTRGRLHSFSLWRRGMLTALP